jgi:hypothetical protein
MTQAFPRAWRPAVRSAQAVAAVAVAVLMLVGCGAGLTTSTQQQAISRALVASGGRQIVVPVHAGGCVRRSALRATETASRVTLVLTQFLQGSICPADLLLGTASVMLRHPLSGRSLIDGTSGRRVPAFDGGKFLRVTYLPPGYRFSGYFPAAYPAWDRQFTSRAGSEALLQVSQVPANVAAPPAWPVAGRAVIGAHAATVRVGQDNGQVFGRAISWSASGYTFVVLTIVTRAGQRALTVAELTKIGDGLH